MSQNPQGSWIGHPDRMAGIAITLVGAFLLYTASSLSFGKLTAPDAGFFPIILTTALTGLGAVLFLTSFRSEKFSLEMTWQSLGVVVCAAALLIYALVVNRVGFIVSTIAIL